MEGMTFGSPLRMGWRLRYRMLIQIYLFGTNVRENIRMGKLSATDKEVEAARAFPEGSGRGLP